MTMYRMEKQKEGEMQEFADGHIAGALHVPSGKFQDEAEVDKVIENLPTNGTVVVHCMLSQVRGPKCANRWLSSLDEASIARV